MAGAYEFFARILKGTVVHEASRWLCNIPQNINRQTQFANSLRIS